MRKLVFLTILFSLASAPAVAGNYQDRAVATGVVIGASAGAVIGAQNGRTAEGAIIGGVMGAVAGAIFANNTYVEPRPEVYRRTVYVRQHKPYRHHKDRRLHNRSHYGKSVYQARQYEKRYAYAHRQSRHER